MHWAAPLVGRAFIEMGDLNRGLRVLQEGVAAQTRSRSGLLRPYYFVLLAGALLRAGLLDKAQDALDESTAVADATGQHAYVAEHARIQAEIHVLGGDDTTRRTDVHAGARPRPASRAPAGSSSAPRAATRTSSSSAAAAPRPRAILAPVVAWFTEGRETMDYLYADGLLKTLD